MCATISYFSFPRACTSIDTTASNKKQLPTIMMVTMCDDKTASLWHLVLITL